MSAKKGYLFCMDLRIYNQIIKLKVYEQDSLTDLINRLAASIKQKQVSKDKLKGRLQEQFKKVITKSDLSETVKSKLDSLLDESKIIIVGIDIDKHQRSLNETPFRILQQSTINGKKATSEKLQKSTQQLNRESSNFNFKYDSQQIGTYNPHYYEHQDMNTNNLISRTRNSSPSKLSYEMIRNNQESSTEILQKRYEALDRKCQNYISKNIPNAELLDFKRHHPQQYEHNAREVQQYERRGGCKQLMKQNDQKLRQQNQYLRAFSRNQLNIYGQTAKPSQTFQQYKLNRYKDTTTSPNKIHKYEQSIQRKYLARADRENIMPSKSITRLKYASQKGGYSKPYADSNHPTIRNYDNLLNTKLLSDTASCKRLKGKFNYLGQ